MQGMLAHRDKALRSATKAVALVPETKDALGPRYSAVLVLVQTSVGDKELAPRDDREARARQFARPGRVRESVGSMRGGEAVAPSARRRLYYWHLVPMFVFDFLALALLRTLGLLPDLGFNQIAFTDGGHHVSLAGLLETVSTTRAQGRSMNSPLSSPTANVISSAFPGNVRSLDHREKFFAAALCSFNPV